MNEASRSIDPSAEALAQLDYELETSAIARKAFAAELIRLRRLAGLCRGRRAELPKKIAAELDAQPRAKSFDHLVALADAQREEQPQLDLAP